MTKTRSPDRHYHLKAYLTIVSALASAWLGTLYNPRSAALNRAYLTLTLSATHKDVHVLYLWPLCWPVDTPSPTRTYLNWVYVVCPSWSENRKSGRSPGGRRKQWVKKKQKKSKRRKTERKGSKHDMVGKREVKSEGGIWICYGRTTSYPALAFKSRFFPFLFPS